MVSSAAPVTPSPDYRRPMPPPAAPPAQPSYEPQAPTAVDGEGDGLDLLAQHLDAQFARLADSLSDVRQLAETNALGQARLTGETLPSMRQQLQALEARLSQPSSNDGGVSGPALADLSAQIQSVQDTVSAMPTPDAIHSLEAGYRHILARLDELKSGGRAADKIDALYDEVTSLREALDGLSDSGTAALVSDMRGMIARLEATPQADPAELREALESVKAMAAGTAGQDVGEAIGAVVERLVALEARIEALAVGGGGELPSSVEHRLDALQEEMQRLTAFQDEARGLTGALDTIREEMRGTSSGPSLAGFDDRFKALDRLEEMTGGYAAQIAALSDRLEHLDGTLASQSEMVRELSALSRHVDTFTTTMPVREIEQALLDLTGRVTSLQEDRSAERLAEAVRDLGERVESCLQSVPRTETLVAAVEAEFDSRLSSALAPLGDELQQVNNRLVGLERTIGKADTPLIDHLSGRLETLLAAMPTPNPDGAISQLEGQLSELLAKAEDGGSVASEDLLHLHDELARARASVELGGNHALQQSIVDQVRHLADRFDMVRQSGDAALLPEIEQKIDDLAERVQAIGLFSADSGTPAHDPSVIPDAVLDRIESRFEDSQAELKPSVDRLQEELTDLRNSAGEQDARLHATLEAVQGALGTVLDRLGTLEAEGHRLPKAERPVSEPPSAARPVDKQPRSHADQALERLAAEAERSERQRQEAQVHPEPAQEAASEPTVEPAAPKPVAEPAAPGDAQTLLNQLSSALHARAQQAGNSASASGIEPAEHHDASPAPSADTAAQRANFIAAARRAAQNAALEATGGVGDLGRDKARAESTEPAFAEPSVTPQPQVPETRTAARVSPDMPRMPQPATEDARLAGSPEGSKQEGEKKGKALFSGPIRLALFFFVLAFGLYALTSFLPSGDEGGTGPAPVIGQADDAEVTTPTAPASDVAPASDAAPATVPDEPAPSDQSSLPSSGGAIESSRLPAIDTDVAPADPQVPNALVAAPAGVDTALSSGFSRDRGPVMAATPGAVEPATAAQEPSAAGDAGDLAAQPPARPSPPPANDLGLLLDPTIPPLPGNTATDLAEAVGPPRLRLAATNGDAAAQFEVATRFMEGRFVTQDLQAAAYWYGQAARQGLAPAAYRLGSFYEQGRGVDRNPDGAIGWYERAALDGNPRAMHNLAVMAAEGRNGGPDFVRAASWFLPAANRGLSDSQFNLAVLYARGMGVERDLMESYKWFALSANAGDSEAASRRDEVAGVLGEQALALARARVDNWAPIPVEQVAIEVPAPEGGWDPSSVQARADTAASAQIAEVQRLLAERGYNPGPADGVIGPRTSDAVRAFRQSLGLGQGAAIDSALLDALRAGTSL